MGEFDPRTSKQASGFLRFPSLSEYMQFYKRLHEATGQSAREAEDEKAKLPPAREVMERPFVKLGELKFAVTRHPGVESRRKAGTVWFSYEQAGIRDAFEAMWQNLRLPTEFRDDLRVHFANPLGHMVPNALDAVVAALDRGVIATTDRPSIRVAIGVTRDNSPSLVGVIEDDGIGMPARLAEKFNWRGCRSENLGTGCKWGGKGIGIMLALTTVFQMRVDTKGGDGPFEISLPSEGSPLIQRGSRSTRGTRIYFELNSALTSNQDFMKAVNDLSATPNA